MVKELLQDKKKMMVVAVVLLAVIGIIIWLRSRKSQESNYVMPRGFFPSTPAPTPTPPPEPTPTPTPPPGDSMGTPPPAPTPPPPINSGNPAVPYPPYGYGYPGPMYYNPFPRTYIVDEARPNRYMNKGEYIQTLINSINVLEDRYDQAISDLTFGRAIRIANQIKGLRADLKAQLRYS